MMNWRDGLVASVEKALTWHRERQQRLKEKRKAKNQLLEWIKAFLWAAGVVLLINQYLLQAYQIPSGSMIDTLRERDHIFVNKLIFGPELLPGIVKVPGVRRPQRAEVIIFENPSYIGKGTLFEIMQRIVYMVTLSLVDIDRDQFGNPRAHFLIKRAVGVGGDRFRQQNGDISILPEGEAAWMSEAEFQAMNGLFYPIGRLIEPDRYAQFQQAGEALARKDMLLPLTERQSAALSQLAGLGFVDALSIDRERIETLWQMRPHDRRMASRRHIYESGWYVPEGYMFPLGDNRDNSRDGRFFGPVPIRSVLGRAMFKYWPIARIGQIR